MEITSDALKIHHKTRVTEIILEIGTLTCVEPEALRTALNAYKVRDVWKNVSFVFNEINGTGKCLECGHPFPMDDFFTICPACKGINIEILEGKEFRIKSITME